MAIPTEIPTWAIGGSAQKITEPSVAQKDIGYTDGDFPNLGEFNYLFNTYYLWIKYIKDELVVTSGTSQSELDGIEGLWTYIDLTAFNLLIDPVPNIRINRKISQLGEDVQIVIDDTIAGLQLNTVGNITGFNISINETVASIVSGGGVVDLHRLQDTAWNPEKVLRLENGPAPIGAEFINASGTNWATFGISGIMATSVTAFAPGLSVYMFVVSHIGASGFDIFMDTSITGANLNNDYRSFHSLSVSQDVYLRRIGATVTLNDFANSRTIALPVINKGNRFYCQNNVIPGATNTYLGKKIYFDSAGNLIFATGSFATTQAVNLVTDYLAPLLNMDRLYYTDIYISGVNNAFSTITVTELVKGLNYKRSYSIGNEETYIAVGDELSRCGNVFVELSETLVTITNIGGNIEYLDISIRGWQDTRGQYALT